MNPDVPSPNPDRPSLRRRSSRSALQSGWLAGLLGLILVGLVAGVAIIPGLAIQISIGPVAGTLPPVTSTPLVGSAAPSVSPTFSRPTPTPQPSPIRYVVKRGDTLLGLGRVFETSGRSIAFWNRATYPSLDPDSPKYDPNNLQIGWVLQITPGVVVDEADLPTPSPVAATPSLAAPSVSTSG